MSFSEVPLASREVYARILSILHRYHLLTFTEVADALPELTWHQLLNALVALHARDIVTLSALRFDYQVKLRKPKRPVLGTADSVRSPIGRHPDHGGVRSVSLGQARRDAGVGAGRMKVL